MSDKVIRRIFSSQTGKNSMWIVAEQVVQMLIGLVLGMLSARYLGPSNYGLLNYSATFVSFFMSIAALGIDSVLIQKIVNNPEQEGKYIGSSIVLRLIASLTSTFSIGLIIFILNPTNKIKMILGVLQSTQLIFRSFYVIDTWFQRYLLSKYTAIGKMISSILVAGYRIFILATAKSIFWFAITGALTDLIISLILIGFYKLNSGPKLIVSMKAGSEILQISKYYILSDLMISIYKYMDRIMIGQMLTDTDVGYYVAATTVGAVWEFLPIAIITSFRPTILEAKKNKNELFYQRRLKQLITIIFWVSFAITVVISVFSKKIITILYGEAYLEASNTIGIIASAEVFAILASARSIWILAEGKNRLIRTFISSGLVVNLVLNYILIPILGINGAAIATLATEITVTIVTPLIIKETRDSVMLLVKGIVLVFNKER